MESKLMQSTLTSCILFVCLHSFVYSFEPPNIVFVLSDDTGWGEIEAAGNPILKTPNLNRLYRESLRLTNFHVAPTCAPTRAQLMTGNHEFRSGVTRPSDPEYNMSPSAITLAEVLQSAGYATGLFGKWHLGTSQKYRPENRGFDMALTAPKDTQNGHYDPTLLRNGKEEQHSGYRTDIFFDEAMEWIEANRQRPFFCYVPTYNAHSPLVVPEKYAAPYRNKGLIATPPPWNPKVIYDGADYYGMVANLDENIGRLLAFLEQEELLENTIFIYAGDNGHAMGGPVPTGHSLETGFHDQSGALYNMGLRGAKDQPWDGGTRVPLFVRWPGHVRPGAEVDRVTGGIDLFPTLAEITGAEYSHSIDGQSLVPLIEDPDAEVADRRIMVHCDFLAGKTDEVKYVEYAVQTDHYRMVNGNELYDHRTDPGEKKNIAEARPKVLAKLNAVYESWWDSVLPTIHNEEVRKALAEQ